MGDTGLCVSYVRTVTSLGAAVLSRLSCALQQVMIDRKVAPIGLGSSFRESSQLREDLLRKHR
jgi:hypothetical protein